MSEKKSKLNRQQTDALTAIMNLHVRAMACHCECMGMNAENSWSICMNQTPPFAHDSYLTVMRKWGLVNEKGESII